MAGWDPVKALRRAGFAFFGVFNGTEVNPDFESQLYDIPAMGSQEAKDSISLILVCQIGGDLTPTTSSKNGKQSRRLPPPPPGVPNRQRPYPHHRLKERQAEQVNFCL